MKKKFSNLDLLDLTKLSKLSGVPYGKIYFRKVGRTEDNFDERDATKLINTIVKHLGPAVENMGFKISINKID